MGSETQGSTENSSACACTVPKSHQHKAECKHVLVAGASCTRKHFCKFVQLSIQLRVAKCTAGEAVLQPVLDEKKACQCSEQGSSSSSSSGAPA